MDSKFFSTARHSENPEAIPEVFEVLEKEIPSLSCEEVELRLLAFSLREIDRARRRINSIPNLSSAQARALYHRLLRSFVIEHDTHEEESSAQRRAA